MFTDHKVPNMLHDSSCFPEKKQVPTAAAGKGAKQVLIEPIQVLVFHEAHHHRREYIHAQFVVPAS